MAENELYPKKPGFRETRSYRGKKTVFGSGKDSPKNLNRGTVSLFGAFRRTARDHDAEARVTRSRTAELMGDPTPGRPRPESDVVTSPILLTFREMRARYDSKH